MKTKNKKLPMLILSAMMAIGGLSNVSAATVLFNDTFNTANITEDINANLSRETGTLAPISYLMRQPLPTYPGGTTYSIVSNALNYSMTGSSYHASVTPNYDFALQGGHLSFSVDFQSLNVAGQGSSSAFIIGGPGGPNTIWATAGVTCMVLIPSSNTIEIHDGAYTYKGSTTLGTTGQDLVHLRFDINTVGGNVTVQSYKNDVLFNTFTRAAYTTDYVSLCSQNSGVPAAQTAASWDNLMVTIPEPSMIGLLGLSALVVLQSVRRIKPKTSVMK